MAIGYWEMVIGCEDELEVEDDENWAGPIGWMGFGFRLGLKVLSNVGLINQLVSSSME